MLNKKRLLAMGLSTAMIATAFAGCSNSSSSSTPESSSQTAESSSNDESKPAESTPDETKPEASEIKPSYSVEAGKAIDFEDGNTAFIKQNLANVAADEATLEVVDFNGSKALKVTPNSTTAGKIFEFGLDLNAILGDKVADVATVSMQIGVESVDGKFHAVTGTVKENSTSTNQANWSTYIETKNPNEITLTVKDGYKADSENVLVITKNSNSGNNSDSAYNVTEAYSTLYIDNIVFFDKDNNAIEVDSTKEFAAENYGFVDWSNLTEVKDQTIIPGFTVSDGKGWTQYPTDALQNIVTKEAVDEDGNPVLDEDGNPTYDTSGNYDWASIIKPGFVMTIYFSGKMDNDKDGNPVELNDRPVWLVTGDWSSDPAAEWGWARFLYDDSTALPLENYKMNDSKTICQLTYDDFVEGFEALSAKNGTGMKFDELDLAKRSFMFQLESSASSWAVSCVTYAYTDAE